MQHYENVLTIVVIQLVDRISLALTATSLASCKIKCDLVCLSIECHVMSVCLFFCPGMIPDP
jgi:hypothetical protein